MTMQESKVRIVLEALTRGGVLGIEREGRNVIKFPLLDNSVSPTMVRIEVKTDETT